MKTQTTIAATIIMERSVSDDPERLKGLLGVDVVVVGGEELPADMMRGVGVEVVPCVDWYIFLIVDDMVVAQILK